jgi:hypothetical protein
MCTAYTAILPTGALVAYGLRRSGMLESWFRLHLGLQIAGVALATASVIVIKTFLMSFQNITASLHGSLAVALMVLTLSQLVLGLAHPSQTHGIRVVWHYAHVVLAVCVLAVFAATAFAGFTLLGDLFGVDTSDVRNIFATWLAIEIVSTSFICSLLLRGSESFHATAGRVFASPRRDAT